MFYSKCATKASKGDGDIIIFKTLSLVFSLEKMEEQSVLVRIDELL